MVKIITAIVAIASLCSGLRYDCTTACQVEGQTTIQADGHDEPEQHAKLTPVKVKPQSNPGGKLLTMEDANINPAVYPQRARPPKSTKTATSNKAAQSTKAAAGNKATQNTKAAAGDKDTRSDVQIKYGQKDGSVYMLVTTLHTSVTDTVWIARATGAVSYGVSVSRNEFGINGGLFPSPDGKRLAYYRKDESKVGIFPLLDITSRTGSLIALRYPMNGMDSERVDLCIWDSETRTNITIDADALTEPAVCDPQSKSCTPELYADDRYLTNISWQDDKTILIQAVDRSQHYCKLVSFDATTGELTGTILREENPEWVEPYEPTHPISPDRFIYSTDNRNGFKNLYLCDLKGNIIRIPTAHADVQFKAYRDGWLYYTSSEISPAENHFFRIKLTLPRRSDKGVHFNQPRSDKGMHFNQPSSDKGVRFGKPQRLTSEQGWHSITMLPDGWFDTFSSFDNPGWSKVFSDDGKLRETLVESRDPLGEYASCEVEFGTVPSADGLYQNHYRLIKPLNFDPQKKYPLIVYVYGGPHSQMVHDSWLGNIRMWEMLMAQRGYVVYCQDNRGTQCHGAAYEKAISRCCGQAEMQDQMVGIRALLAEPWIDSTRVGVHGWSYGGFMTISLATTYPEVFKVAVAGGPVIDWKWYEIMYGERYMDTELTNPEGFALTSLLGKANKLQCRLLICQGAIDDTVVWQHSLSFLQECIDEGKQVEYFPFPKAYHNMMGRERVYLYQKITDYFDNNL